MISESCSLTEILGFQAGKKNMKEAVLSSLNEYFLIQVIDPEGRTCHKTQVVVVEE